MSETKQYHAQFTPRELVVILRASIRMGTLMRQHREFLINVLANYMGEQEHAQLVRLLDRQYEEMSKKCAQATYILNRERQREEEGHGQ